MVNLIIKTVIWHDLFVIYKHFQVDIFQELIGRMQRVCTSVMKPVRLGFSFIKNQITQNISCSGAENKRVAGLKFEAFWMFNQKKFTLTFLPRIRRVVK